MFQADFLRLCRVGRRPAATLGPPGAGCRGRTHAELEADAARRPRADGKHRLGRVLAADGSDLEVRGPALSLPSLGDEA